VEATTSNVDNSTVSEGKSERDKISAFIRLRPHDVQYVLEIDHGCTKKISRELRENLRTSAIRELLCSPSWILRTINWRVAAKRS